LRRHGPLDIMAPSRSTIAIGHQELHWGKEHGRRPDVTLVPRREEILVDYGPGEATVVELHDGTLLMLRKLERDYDPTDRSAAARLLEESRQKQELATGLLYVHPDQPALQEMLGQVEAPLAGLAEDVLRPDRQLDRILSWNALTHPRPLRSAGAGRGGGIMRTFGILAGLAAAGIWGGMYVVSKVMLEEIPPFRLLTLRLLLGILALGTVVLIRGRGAVSRRQTLRLLGIGVIGFGISVGLQFVGTALSTAANAALITSASPAFILLFGVLLLGEPVTFRRMAALLLASLGVLAVLNPVAVDLSQGSFRNLALLGAAITWGLYSVLVKQASREVAATEVSLIGFAGGLFVSLPLALAEGKPGLAGPVTVPIVLGVLYLGLISTALAMYLWNRSLAILEAGLVSLLLPSRSWSWARSTSPQRAAGPRLLDRFAVDRHRSCSRQFRAVATTLPLLGATPPRTDQDDMRNEGLFARRCPGRRDCWPSPL
jgi:drug/metabolite transporter (DMT)-like permease